ncbi:sulfite exporter TauE/SafE family protein [Petroclostridium sp. X23]|uniref:sulfite exporter TauE/SafE family protein n=1 Tax=Petroclostridium sp. X23 TaxID=3045146 RepID=UPI0024ADEECE|nr:sulfite exporter TauE/SafE family protein [Petroclostridium sp. X23]WHH59684.1 sulfite exporter TauE/SafE family protein [Petroclostridium sp. X23]
MKKLKKYVKYTIIGMVTGLCNGLFGSGGGTIAVPAMEIVLDVEEHRAHATALAIILPLTLVSVFFYIRNDYVNWDLTWQVAIGGVIGGYVGARILKNIPSNVLRKIFGIFMIVAAIRMVI